MTTCSEAEETSCLTTESFDWVPWAVSEGCSPVRLQPRGVCFGLVVSPVAWIFNFWPSQEVCFSSLLKYCDFFVWCSHCASRNWTYLEHKGWMSPWKLSHSASFRAGGCGNPVERASIKRWQGCRISFHSFLSACGCGLGVGGTAYREKGFRWCTVTLVWLPHV